VQNNDGIAPYIQSLAVDPTQPSRLYLLKGKQPFQVLVSTDAGVTLSTLYTFPQGMDVSGFIVVSSDGNTLYCGRYSLFRSTDRGQTWRQQTDVPGATGGAVNKLQIDPSDANTLYAVRSDALFVTHDGGATWINITPPTDINVNDLAIDPSNANRLWVAGSSGLSLSTDRGTSWSFVRNEWMTAVALDPRSPSVVYAADDAGAIFKEGSGAIWTDVAGNLGSSSPSVIAIAVSPQDSSRIFVATVSGLWLTTTGGGNWARSDSGLVASYVTGFAPSSGRVYLAGNPSGMLADGSDSVAVFDESALSKVGVFSNIFTALTPVGAPSGGLIGAISYTNIIVLTTDQGVTWSRLYGYPGAGPDFIVDLAATTTSPSVYYASSQLTLQRSVDQGATWTAITTGLPAGYSPGVLAIAPSSPTTLYAAPQGSNGMGVGLYKSTNGGDSWTSGTPGKLYSIISALAVDPTQPNIVYAATQSELLKTVDGGATWAPIQWSSDPGESSCATVVIDPSNPNVVYAAGGSSTGVVARSADGGATWAHLTSASQPVPWMPTAVAIDPARPVTVRVGTSTAGTQQMNLQPDLAIVLSPFAANLPLGAPVPYNVEVLNLGHLPATGVIISIELPAGSSQPAGNSKITANPSSGSCTIAASSITCTASTMNGDAITVSGVITPSALGTFQVTASVQADQSDIDPSNNTSTQSSTVAPVPGPSSPPSGGGGGALSPLLLLALFALTFARAKAGPAPKLLN
jgi:photosystem II stability/assembly factor-like uncharacterized protein